MYEDRVLIHRVTARQQANRFIVQNICHDASSQGYIDFTFASLVDIFVHGAKYRRWPEMNNKPIKCLARGNRRGGDCGASA
ncbi:hypothetical protein PoB_004621900 [Plakobranchus ocellatus]|uniref:Uncharacterized protein n=1 Tax=Plakobranchus ocellatus TaxID=259542 RepID=A0AAV4BHZ2_9GAST|nr:hypothetical protein PoB_004621900 [Plakobranchus ocellatus]